MKRLSVVLGVALLLGACEAEDAIFVEDGLPAPPVALDGSYYNLAIRLTWELSSEWNGEFFRVYGRRTTAASFLSIADVTSCSDGLCEYTDTNITANTSYEYFVSAVDPDTGSETESEVVLAIDVPSFDAPPVPTGTEVIALDDANFVRWSDLARAVDDFSFYRVYLLGDGDGFLLGETDSEGFVDLLAANGVTSRYAVTSVDQYGHESAESVSASGTPRPDFKGELLFAFGDDPSRSGFRFQEDESSDPIRSGSSGSRHFRLEVDAFGWWIVPGPDAEIFPTGVFTTELKCGVAADAGCEDWTTAPTAGYSSIAVAVEPEFTYMLRVVGDDGQIHYGAVRVALVGTDQTGASVMVFDWAYQIQANNPSLTAGG
jgi:hypothetical protein